MSSSKETNVRLSAQVVAKLNDRLLEYKTDLSEISKDLAEAAALGDLKENREFELAKQSEALKKEQMARLVLVLSNCVVEEIPEDKIYSKVEAMTSVVIHDVGNNTDEQVYVVIDFLGDVGEVSFHGEQLTPDKIAISAPLGKTLVNKPVGSTVTFSDKKYRVVSVSPIDYEEFFGS